jgi:Family of unknown function (DUF5662)
VKSHWAYFKYVVRHKWFVFMAGRCVGVSFWRLLIHDWSKFLPSEWDAYVRSFYNRDGSKRDWKTRDPFDKQEFDAAWNHHQKVNKHHWQYWCLVNDSDDPKIKPLLMPEKFWREMIADWMGAGRAITGQWEVWSWYEKNRNKILLHDYIRNAVELELVHLQSTKARADRLGLAFP